MFRPFADWVAGTPLSQQLQNRLWAVPTPQLGGTLPPRAARLAGGLSATFWVAVIFFGRRVGFTT